MTTPDPTAAPVPEADTTWELAVTMLSEAASEVDRADQKASLLIGGLGIAFSIVLSGLLSGDWTPGAHHGGVVLWSAGAIVAIASVIASALAVWPRLSKAPAEGTISYWGQVRELRSAAEVEDALRTRGLHDPERTFQQLMVLAAVVQRKYRYIRLSMVLAGAAALLVPLAFVFSGCSAHPVVRSVRWRCERGCRIHPTHRTPRRGRGAHPAAGRLRARRP